MAQRYNFSPDEIQRRAKLSSDLKKKLAPLRKAKTEDKKKKPGAGEGKKKAPKAAPKVDLAAIRTAKRDRRHFIGGTLAFSGAMAFTAGGTNRFMFPRILFEPPTTFEAGSIDDFLPGVPHFIKEFKTWIIRTDDGIIYAMSGRCTHLGCTPAFLASEQKFKCPCHGSGFRITGVNFEGPAPRALERFHISLVGGVIIVDKAKMFLYEKGDWEKPDSFLVV